MSGTRLSFLILDALDSRPATNDTRPSDDRVENDCVRMDNHVLEDDRVFDSGAVAHLNLCSDRDVWSDPCTWMDLGRWVYADQALDLVRI